MPEHEQQHEVDVVGHVEVRADFLVVAAERLDACPRRAVAVVRVAGIGPAADVPVAVDRLIVGLVAAEVVGLHVGVPAFAQVVHAPVRPVDVQVHEPAVRIDVTHLQHRVVGEPVGHIKAALHHVVRTGPQVELVELPHRLDAVVVPLKKRIAQLAHAVFAPEIDAKVFLGKICPRTDEVPDPGIHLKAGGLTARLTPGNVFQRPKRLRHTVDRRAGGDDHGRQTHQ